MRFTNRPATDNRPCCVVDFDGVIFNLMYALELLVDEASDGNTHFNRSNILTYDFNKSLEECYKVGELETDVSAFGISRESIYKYLGDTSIYKYRAYYSGIREAISRVAEFIPVVIYSYCYTDKMAGVKADLFQAWTKGIENVYFCASSDDDKYTKSCYPNARFVIEDSLANISAYIKSEDFDNESPRTGLYLVDQTYNQEKYNSAYQDDFIYMKRVNSCADALKHIYEKHFFVYSEELQSARTG